MKRSPNDDVLQQIGQNAIDLLNEVPLYCSKWIPLLEKLATKVDPRELAPFLTHGTKSNVYNSLQKASTQKDNVTGELFESKPRSDFASPGYYEKQEEAKDFLVENTKEDKITHRLVTKDTVENLYANYIGTIKDPLSKDVFTNIYRSQRILKDRHCKHDIYTCPYCDDYFATAQALLERLPEESADYRECKSVVDKLCRHKENWKSQTRSFFELWNNPPKSSVVLAEDAGKRFVLDGKGVVHVMMLRFVDDAGVHEHHYFFCIVDSPPTVSRNSIAQCWLSLKTIPGAIPPSTRVIYNWHDGGTNEFNNSSILLLFATLQNLWKIEFVTNSFIAYHGKGAWDGLLGDAARIMTARASLVELQPELHYDKEFYYRAVASIKGKNAEVSKAFEMKVPTDMHWCAKKWKFDTSNEEKIMVSCYSLSSSDEPFQCVELKMKNSDKKLSKDTGNEKKKKEKKKVHFMNNKDKKLPKDPGNEKKKKEKKKDENNKSPEIIASEMIVETPIVYDIFSRTRSSRNTTL
jgi:hypothetical protein